MPLEIKLKRPSVGQRVRIMTREQIIDTLGDIPGWVVGDMDEWFGKEVVVTGVANISEQFESPCGYGLTNPFHCAGLDGRGSCWWWRTSLTDIMLRAVQEFGYEDFSPFETDRVDAFLEGLC